jgi:hypothetical protein
MRPIGKPYKYKFEPEMLDLWLRHHLRCWWKYTGNDSYSSYAKHTRVTEDTLKHACLGLIDPPLQILNDMRCEWVKRDKEYEMTIQRYTNIPHEGVEDE